MTEYVCVDKNFTPMSRTTSDIALAHSFAKIESTEGYDLNAQMEDAQIVIVCEAKTLTPEAFYYNGSEYQ